MSTLSVSIQQLWQDDSNFKQVCHSVRESQTEDQAALLLSHSYAEGGPHTIAKNWDWPASRQEAGKRRLLWL